MGLGAPALNTSQFQQPGGGGPPFPATAADNGLSVDAGTGRIVLGNDTGGNAAQLLNNREIILNGFSLKMPDGTATYFTYIDNVTMGLFEDTPFAGLAANFELAGVAARVRVTADLTAGGQPEMNLVNTANPADDVIQRLETIEGYSVLQNSAAPVHMLTLNNSAGRYKMGDIDAFLNGLLLSMDDTAATLDINNTLSDAAVLINGATVAGSEKLALIGDIAVKSPGVSATTNFYLAGTLQGFVGSMFNNSYLQSNSGNVVLMNGAVGSLTTDTAGNAYIFGTIRTADPGAGQGLWKLGKVQAAASVLDATQYVETMIDGVLVKLAMIV